MFLEDVIGEMRRRSPPCAAWCTTGTPRARGRLEEAMALLKKQEVLCLELGNRSGLAYCYWYWGLLAREQRDRKTEREKLAASLDIFIELNMPRERDEVRAELETKTGAGTAT